MLSTDIPCTVLRARLSALQANSTSPCAQHMCSSIDWQCLLLSRSLLPLRCESILCYILLLWITATVDAAPAATATVTAATGKQLALLTAQSQRQFSQAQPCSVNTRIQHKQAALHSQRKSRLLGCYTAHNDDIGAVVHFFQLGAVVQLLC